MRTLISICLLAAACDSAAPVLVGGKADTGGIAEGTAEALGSGSSWYSGSVAFSAFLNCAVTICKSPYPDNKNDEISFIGGHGADGVEMLGFNYHGQYFPPQPLSRGNQFNRAEYFSGNSPYAPNRTGNGNFHIYGHVDVGGRLLYINDMEYEFHYNPSDYSGQRDSSRAGNIKAPF